MFISKYPIAVVYLCKYPTVTENLSYLFLNTRPQSCICANTRLQSCILSQSMFISKYPTAVVNLCNYLTAVVYVVTELVMFKYKYPTTVVYLCKYPTAVVYFLTIYSLCIYDNPVISHRLYKLTIFIYLQRIWCKKLSIQCETYSGNIFPRSGTVQLCTISIINAVTILFPHPIWVSQIHLVFVPQIILENLTIIY